MERKGLSASGKGNTPKFLAYYENCKANNESLYLDSEQFADIISYYTINGLYKEALVAADDAIAIHPESPNILFEKAYAHLYLKDFIVAKSIANKLIKIEKNNDILLLNIDIVLADPNSNKELARFFLNELEHKDDIDTIIDVCYTLLDNDGQAPPSLIDEWIDKGLELYPNNRSFLEVYTEYLKNSGQLDLGIIVLNRLLDIEPYNTYYWWILAMIYYEKEIFDKCKESLEFTIVTDEDFADAYLILGQLYHMEDKIEEAIENYQSAIDKCCSDMPTAYLFLSICYLHINSPKTNETFKLAVDKAFHESYLPDDEMNEEADEEIISELQGMLQINRLSYENHFKEIEENKLLNLPVASNETVPEFKSSEFEKLDKNIQEILNQLHNADHRSDFECHDDDDLINAIIAIENKQFDKVKKLALRAEKQSKSVIALYELGTVFLQINELAKAKKIYKRVNKKLNNYNDVIYDLALLSLLSYDIVNFEKYNANLEEKIDLKDVNKIIENLENLEKHAMIKVIKDFQKRIDGTI